MSDTAAPAAPPPASDPGGGELGPPIERAAPERPSFEQQRFAQDQAAAKPPAAATADKPAPGADQQQPPATAAEKIKIGKFEVSEEQLGEMMTRQAAEDLRAAARPQTPEAYKLEISPDTKLPGDAQFKFDASDPGLIAAKNWAHGKGLDQTTFSEMLTLYASHVASQETALAERSRAEIAKIGVNGPQRVDAVGKWIVGMIGEADAAPVKATIVTDSHLRFYETIMNKLTSQGGAPFSQSHRVPPETNTIPNYDNMSFEQRRQAQDINAQARRGGR